MPGPAQRGKAAAAAVVLLGLLAGCGAAPVPGAGASAPSSSATPAPAVVPVDGVLLRSVGLVNGPVDAFSLPRTTVLTSVVDQPSAVTLVISQPAAGEIYAYLERALPAAGFRVLDAAPAAGTLTFVGRGWTGSFTGDARASAVLLRPV